MEVITISDNRWVLCRLKKERWRWTEEVRKMAGKNQEVCLSLRKRMNKKRFDEYVKIGKKRENNR